MHSSVAQVKTQLDKKQFCRLSVYISLCELLKELMTEVWKTLSESVRGWYGMLPWCATMVWHRAPAWLGTVV